ncbi:MAG: GHKL domain-containing protein [Enterococcus faecalis]|nr:GHKL domain-containing protein [Enterococcus faecalis]
MVRFVFILSNITAVVQVFFNYLKSKVVKLNKKITLHSIFGLMVIAILNGKIISAIGMYGFAWIYLSIIILGYFFISKSLIKVLGINSYIVIISAVSGQFVSFIKEKIFGTELIFSSNLTMFLHSTFRLALSVILTILMIKGIKKLEKKFSIINECLLLFNLIGIGTMIIYYTSLVLGKYLGNNKEIIVVNSIFLTLYLVVSLISFIVYLSSLKNKYDIQQKETEYLENQRYMEAMEKQFKEIRKFRHDYKNILNSLEDFIVSGDYESLNDYYFSKIKKASKCIDQNRFKLEAIGNIRVREVKSLLVSKLISTQEKGMDVQLEVTEPIEELAIDSISLVRILGIFLDNSIEEIEFLGEGKLVIAVYKDASAVHIIIQNSCRINLPKFHLLKQRGFSLKGTDRGMGLSNVQELLQSLNNVQLATSISDRWFTQKLTIENNRRCE